MSKERVGTLQHMRSQTVSSLLGMGLIGSLGLRLITVSLAAQAQDATPPARVPSIAPRVVKTRNLLKTGTPSPAVAKSANGQTHSLTMKTYTGQSHPERHDSPQRRVQLSSSNADNAQGERNVFAGQTVMPRFGSKGERPALAFTTGDFVPPLNEKVQPALMALAHHRLVRGNVTNHAGELVAPSVYGLLLLNSRLDDPTRAALKALGVELTGYYPYNAYQARVPSSALNALATLPRIRWFGQPSAQQKLAPELRPLLAQGNVTLLNVPKQRFIVSFFADDSDGRMRADVQAAGAKLGYYASSIASQSIEADSSILKRLVGMDHVLYIEPDRIGSAANELGLTTVNADFLWDGSHDPQTSSNPVKIGLLDTGCYAYHQDFGNIFGGMLGFSLVSGENWYDDLDHHGTHVSGTILGEGLANTRYRGVAAGLVSHGDGENPDYLVAQVLDQTGHGSSSNLVQGIDLLNTSSGHAGYKRQLWNASLGGYGTSPTDAPSREVDAAFGNGVLPVIAAGNSGPGSSTVSTPGNAKGALTVGAIYNNTESGQITDTITGYSSRGPIYSGFNKPDVVAPGSYVDSTLSGTYNDYTYDWQGTSMATPHVTGLAAGLIGQFPGMPAWGIKSVIMANTIDLGYDRNTQGLGKVDGLSLHYNIDGFWHTWWSTIGSTGSIQYVDVSLPQNAAELRIVMTYPDPPAAAGASSALVNDLDLKIQYSANGSGLTTDTAYTYADNGVDPVAVVKISNAPAGTYRVKIYSYNVSSTQAWAFTARAVYSTLNPNISTNLSVPYAVQPNTTFFADATAYSGNYIASGVVGSISLDSGVTNQGLWFRRQSKPSTGTEWIWFPSNWSSTPPGYYETAQMNMGNIAAGYTREMGWNLQGTSEGAKNITFTTTSANGGTSYASGTVIVDGTPPTFGTAQESGWTSAFTCNVAVPVQDTLSGLAPTTGFYRYSTNGGTTWNGWQSLSSTGGYGTTASQTLTATGVAFGQNSANNQIEFAIEDTAGNLANSPAYTVTLPTPASVVITPNPVPGGMTATGTLTLSGPAPADGATVALATNNIKVMLPASVTVPAGATSTTFSIPTHFVTGASVSGKLTATYLGSTLTTQIVVRALGLSSISASPSSLYGGSTSASVTVALEGITPANVTVTLASSNSGVAVPATIVVPAGHASATFIVTGPVVTTATMVQLKATLGTVTRATNLTVLPVTPVSLTISPSTVKGPATAQGVMTLSAHAPTGGLTVTLLSNNSAASPAVGTFTIPAGQLTGKFTINTKHVSAATTVTISVKANGVTRTATIQVNP